MYANWLTITVFSKHNGFFFQIRTRYNTAECPKKNFFLSTPGLFCKGGLVKFLFVFLNIYLFFLPHAVMILQYK